MALRTFGAVLKFALDLEATAAAFYETVTTMVTNQELKSLFEALVVKGQKRIEMLMRVRRENTTEMILEPIQGLEGQRYRPNTECPEDSTDSDILKLATTMENTVKNFFLQAAEKVSFLSEAANVFEDLAEEHKENQMVLEATLYSSNV